MGRVTQVLLAPGPRGATGASAADAAGTRHRTAPHRQLAPARLTTYVPAVDGDEHHRPVGDNPPLAMASSAYRRRFGEWPHAVRFAPSYFAGYASGLSGDQLELLCTVFDVTVSKAEASSRLTVSGPEGALTYDDGVEESDWDQTPFDRWLESEAARPRP